MLDKIWPRSPTTSRAVPSTPWSASPPRSKGDISFAGGLRIDGKVKGNITARADDNSTLVLCENAAVSGDVSVPHMIVNGKIKGNVRSVERLELQAKAEITGDVTYKVLEMRRRCPGGRQSHPDATTRPRSCSCKGVETGRARIGAND
ncbi:MAG: polymer-forming cytoskeletal protein [Comamonadaceae bacterium]|nr:polymer-forming cytoskeletal protein [Comamonadaceae bacterium]